MSPPDIPAAKRAGLPVDLERLAAEGDAWLTPEDRYALKTHGVCTQRQDGVFMVRVRIPGGVALTDQVRGLARVGARHAEDWLHLTTRQNAVLWWALLAFIGSGFEHSIANATIFSIGALEGSIGWGALARNLAWTVPGNVVGGGLVIGLGYAWMASTRTAETTAAVPEATPPVAAPEPAMA